MKIIKDLSVFFGIIYLESGDVISKMNHKIAVAVITLTKYKIGDINMLSR